MKGERIMSDTFVQNESIETVIQRYKGTVYSVALSYTSNRADADDICQEVFLIYFKVKPQFNDEEHRKLTLHSNKNILDCARYLSEIHKPVWIRHVLVPGITDKDEYLQQLRSFLDTLTNIERIDILPYHTLGVYKYEKLGIPYPLQGIESPSNEQVAHANAILQK